MKKFILDTLANSFKTFERIIRNLMKSELIQDEKLLTLFGGYKIKVIPYNGLFISKNPMSEFFYQSIMDDTGLPHFNSQRITNPPKETPVKDINEEMFLKMLKRKDSRLNYNIELAEGKLMQEHICEKYDPNYYWLKISKK